MNTEELKARLDTLTVLENNEENILIVNVLKQLNYLLNTGVNNTNKDALMAEMDLLIRYRNKLIADALYPKKSEIVL